MMLALMPHSHPLPDYHASSTMSLAVLSSTPCSTLQPTTQPASKRPKLNLNTSNITPIFGKNATSLRLETLSATSPTTVNTFSNAHFTPQAPRPKPYLKTALTPLSITTSNKEENIPPPAPIEQVSNPTASTPSSAGSTSSLPLEVPYKLPFNSTSILTNGPIPRTLPRVTSFAQTRPLFPSSKKVAFRSDLTEEIQTTRFTLRHSDITSSREEDANEKPSFVSKLAVPALPKTGDKRDSSDEEDSDTCPATPIAGRRKRHRQWRWTLGPTGSRAAEEDGASEDDADKGVS